jgi:hypothetical protein
MSTAFRSTLVAKTEAYCYLTFNIWITKIFFLHNSITARRPIKDAFAIDTRQIPIESTVYA